MTEFLALKQAIEKLVHPGSSVAMEGFTHLIPHAAGLEIIRQRIRHLTLIRMTPDIIYDQLIGAGCADKLVFSWGGNPGVGSLFRLREAYERGIPHAMEFEEHAHAATTERNPPESSAADHPPPWGMRAWPLGTRGTSNSSSHPSG